MSGYEMKSFSIV